MAAKSVVNEETDTDEADEADEDAVVPLVAPGVVAVFLDELHAARPAAVTTAMDHMATPLAESFILPPPNGTERQGRYGRKRE
jgi:hypothetical protein